MSVTKQWKIRSAGVRFGTLLMVAAAGVLMCSNALGQYGTSGSGSLPSPATGTYSWQITQGATYSTTQFVGSLNYSGTTSPGVAQELPASGAAPPLSFTVHEVHGNVAFSVGSGCAAGSNGAVIAQVRDNNGNTIAGVNLYGLSPSATNVPITATFGTPLTVTALAMETFVTQCSPVTILWSLVMS